MSCKVCNKEIPRGKRYKSERYKNISFCSEQCYTKYLSIQDKKNGTKNALKDYINNLFDQPNWGVFMRQISNLEQEYNLSDNELRMVIKYAMAYEGHTINNQYGLGQFEKYIVPALEFIQAIKDSKNIDIMDEPYIEEIKKSKQRRFRRPIEFD